MTARAGIRLWAVNPAYTSEWGGQHWRRSYENVTRHEAAATVIGRRAQGFKARRREGVTRTRPEDRAVRAANQAGPNSRRANTASRPAGKRGTKSRQPGTGTTMAGRATVTRQHRPATANYERNGVVGDPATVGWSGRSRRRSRAQPPAGDSQLDGQLLTGERAGRALSRHPSRQGVVERGTAAAPELRGGQGLLVVLARPAGGSRAASRPARYPTWRPRG